MWSWGESEFSHPGLHRESEKGLEGSDVLCGAGTVKNGEWPFSRTLLAVLNSGVLTPWRLACIIYDIVLTEFFPASWGVGSVSLVWDVFHSGRQGCYCSALPLQVPSLPFRTFPQLSVFYILSPALDACLSPLSCSFPTSICLLFSFYHTARVISDPHPGATFPLPLHKVKDYFTVYIQSVCTAPLSCMAEDTCNKHRLMFPVQFITHLTWALFLEANPICKTSFI